MAPFVVSALALVFGVGSSFIPVSDIALGELLVRDVGHHPLYQGLYSREDWSHPGPILYVILAPFYWVTGGSSIGLGLGALAINGASVVGMGLIARRRAGRAAMVATFVAVGLLVRTLGAEIWHDSWNCHVTVLPFALLAFLAWDLLAGERWALPVAVFVASFLAQTHVGYVVLAVPLLGCAAIGLVVAAWRSGEDGWWRTLVRPVVVAVVLGGVLWLPPLVDVVNGAPRNLVNAARWLRAAEEGTGTLGDGLKVMSGQFGLVPEWATIRREPGTVGESRYLFRPIVPWLLVVVVGASVVMWRRRSAARPLVVVTATIFVLGVVAVARTIGTQFDYRLLWTWVPAMLAFVIVTVTGWEWLADRRPALVRRAGAVAVAALVVLTAVNGVTATRAGVPAEGDSDVMAAITPEILAVTADADGPVLVTDPFSLGAQYARALVLQLERRGIEAVVPPARQWEQSPHRVHRGEPVAVTLVVALDQTVDGFMADPALDLVTEWRGVPLARVRESVADAAVVTEDLEAGRIDIDTAISRHRALDEEIRGPGGAFAYRVAVFRVR